MLENMYFWNMKPKSGKEKKRKKGQKATKMPSSGHDVSHQMMCPLNCDGLSTVSHTSFSLEQTEWQEGGNKEFWRQSWKVGNQVASNNIKKKVLSVRFVDVHSWETAFDPHGCMNYSVKYSVLWPFSFFAKNQLLICNWRSVEETCQLRIF